MTQPQFVCRQSLYHPDSHDSTTFVCLQSLHHPGSHDSTTVCLSSVSTSSRLSWLNHSLFVFSLYIIQPLMTQPHLFVFSLYITQTLMTQPQFVCLQSLHHPDSHDSTTVCAKFVPTAANQAEVRLSYDNPSGVLLIRLFCDSLCCVVL